MLRWALDKHTQSVVSILDIQKGLEYNCICQSCGMTVIAHKGNEIAHHFKHYNIEECVGGVETAIHLKAKEIIAAVKYIKLPSLSANVSIGGYSASKLILPSSIIELGDVFLEEKEGRIRPDLIAIHKETKILIEIAVTHFIDKNKEEIIRNQDISCIEIDLHELHGSNKNITDEDLIENIIYRLDNKKWIHNRKYKDAKKKAFQIIEQKKQDEINQNELDKKISDKIFNDRVSRVLKNNPKMKIDEDNIFQRENGSNLCEFTLSIDIFLGIKIQESYFERLEFERLIVDFSVFDDNSYLWLNHIFFEDKSISNKLLESFIERKIKEFCRHEDLYSWLRKRAKTLRDDDYT